MRVLDLSRHLPGPLAAHLLADLGARIVKVEEPAAGDPLRRAPPGSDGFGTTGALGAMLLAGVESVALDLKRPAALEVLGSLLARSDVLLETFRPGTLGRFGLAPEVLRERHPRLVVCSLSGWGQTGPYAARAGHDLTYQAVAGALASVAPAGLPGLPFADLAGAWSAVASILAALYEREKTGLGTHVDASLFDAALHSNLTGWAAEAGGPKRVGEPLPLTGALPCYGVYVTADGGWLAVAALEPHFWERLCNAVGRPGLAGAQYARSRRARRRVAELVAGRTRGQWEELLARQDVSVEPVLSAAEARAHPQARDRAVLGEGPDGLPRVGFPARFDGARPRAGEKVPGIGEHTEAVLGELGISLSRRQRQEAGIGPRRTWRRRLARLLGRVPG